jgi:hypothetical protein
MGAGSGVRLRDADGHMVRSVSGLWIVLLVPDREGGMKCRVIVELGGTEGTVQLHEISAGGSATAECSAETLGLTMTEGKLTPGLPF